MAKKKLLGFELTGPKLLSLWAKLAPLPGGKKLFSCFLGVLVPYTGSLGATVQSLEPGKITLSVVERRALRNHLNSMHAAALMNALELGTGLAVITSLGPTQRAILLSFRIDYLKKARGVLRAQGRLGACEGKDWQAEGELTDERGVVVARAVATWRVGD